MSINWQNLRTWNGSQQTAFEKLCCQLASAKEPEEGAQFIPKGDPDAGVECYWVLPNGNEHGWQAKFFTKSPDASQWRQVDQSVKSSLEAHPRLNSYTVCFPIDMPDAREKGKKSCRDRWLDHVEKWEGWAKGRGMSVQFSYWGETELLQRLSQRGQEGLEYFWFNEQVLSDDWLQERLAEAVASAGPRYTPKLRVDLPIGEVFDGLCRSPGFFARLKQHRRSVSISYKELCRFMPDDLVQDECFLALDRHMNELLDRLRAVRETADEGIPFEQIARQCVLCEHAVWPLVEAWRQGDDQASRYSPPVEVALHSVRELVDALVQLEHFSNGDEAKTVVAGRLLLVGKAGTGKTFIFCDVARRRVEEGLPALLLLAKHFRNDEPWQQILGSLDLQCTAEQFLGALGAAARARQSKALILIDALNEGEGRDLWEEHLPRILSRLSGHPEIALAVSVRTSYEDLVIPEHCRSDLPRVEHRGFEGHEYEATEAFFSYYGIQHPATPLLLPEFSNPLFLSLFCKTMQNLGLHTLPPDFGHLTSVFDEFVESINRKLARPQYLDYDERDRYVQKAVQRITELMADHHKAWLSREEARAVVDALCPRSGHTKSLLAHLVSEELLTEDRIPVARGKSIDIVTFAYERFSDHMIAKYLLSKHVVRHRLKHSFRRDGLLGFFLRSADARLAYGGLLEAMSIELAEEHGRELVELAPYADSDEILRLAFIESLLWRRRSAFSNGTHTYIKKCILTDGNVFERFIESVLLVGTDPAHPYNADFLHRLLSKESLPQRDAWWSILLFEQYGQRSAVDRLVEWGSASENKMGVPDEVTRLAATVLAWFLTTSHRFLRDRATKALVRLLEGRVHVLRRILRAFANVDDAYVLERLYAVAYGVAMRSADDSGLGSLAQEMYELVFADDNPPPHVLLRDYARGVVELALHRGLDLDIEVAKIRPPYGSEWPAAIPEKGALAKYDPIGTEHNEAADERWCLYNSVMGDGDFANYVLSPYGLTACWSAHRLGAPREPTPKERLEAFVRSLTKRQKQAWDDWQDALRRAQALTFQRVRLQLASDSEILLGAGADSSAPEAREEAAAAERRFRSTLSGRKLQTFDRHVSPHLKTSSQPRREDGFDVSLAQRWILQRVLELGWRNKLFGAFDAALARSLRYGRGAHKPERIGKKYQWIAYHECLARIADNFQFMGDEPSSGQGHYDGPWQIIYGRDIDPSFVLTKPPDELSKGQESPWWVPVVYKDWDSEPDPRSWVMFEGDILPVEKLLEVVDPADRQRWLVLDAFYSWTEPVPLEEEQFERPRRQLYSILGSYVVRKTDIARLYDWAVEQNFYGRWMPESVQTDQVFIGEYHWAPAFRHWIRTVEGNGDWISREEIPCSLVVTAHQHFQESQGYDCSVEDAMTIRVPSRWIADGMGLRWAGVEGEFVDAQGNVVARDPSIHAAGPSALLVKRDAFLSFLERERCTVLWTLIGEKQVLGWDEDGVQWPGCLKLTGAYRLFRNRIRGQRRATYQGPESK